MCTVFAHLMLSCVDMVKALVFDLYSSLFKLYSSIIYSSMLKTVFERTKVLSSVELYTLKCIQGFLSVGALIIWRSVNWFMMATWWLAPLWFWFLLQAISKYASNDFCLCKSVSIMTASINIL